jgi:hypothetical protein
MDSRRFTVSLSFPSEYREFIAKIADTLEEKLSKLQILVDKSAGKISPMQNGSSSSRSGRDEDPI